MANKRILVVDDEPDNIAFVETVLRREGFTVIAAADGLEGLETAKTELPDLVLLDVQMPKMNGFEAFNELRIGEPTKHIPVVMLTGIREKTGIGFSAEDMKKFIGEGSNGYVEKLISPENLVKVVRENL